MAFAVDWTVIWRLWPGSEPRVVARPPGRGDSEANLSEVEKLRRERQRLRETGITQVVRAEDADVAVLPIGGDLYLPRGDGPLERLTETLSPEIDPRLTRDGTKVAFVRDDELHVLDLDSKRETQLTRGAADGLTHALAEFIAQEEMDRSSGFWWSPDGARIAYQETDERSIPPYSIVNQTCERYHGRDPPLPLRRRGQRQGPPRRRRCRRGRDPMARARRPEG